MKRCSCATARLCRRPNSFSFPCNSLLYFSPPFFSCFRSSFFLYFFCLCCAHFFLCSLINCLASVSVSRDAAAVAACCMGNCQLVERASDSQCRHTHAHCHTHTHTPTQKLASVTIINYCQFTITCMCKCLCVCMLCVCGVACPCACRVLMLPLSCLFPALGPIFNYVFSVCGHFTSQAMQLAGGGMGAHHNVLTALLIA